jgi:hypothetical protein
VGLDLRDYEWTVLEDAGTSDHFPINVRGCDVGLAGYNSKGGSGRGIEVGMIRSSAEAAQTRTQGRHRTACLPFFERFDGMVNAIA